MIVTHIVFIEEGFSLHEIFINFMLIYQDYMKNCKYFSHDCALEEKIQRVVCHKVYSSGTSYLGLDYLHINSNIS